MSDGHQPKCKPGKAPDGYKPNPGGSGTPKLTIDYLEHDYRRRLKASMDEMAAYNRGLIAERDAALADNHKLQDEVERLNGVVYDLNCQSQGHRRNAELNEPHEYHADCPCGWCRSTTSKRYGRQFIDSHLERLTAAIELGADIVEVTPELLVILLEDCGKVLALTGENERLKESADGAVAEMKILATGRFADLPAVVDCLDRWSNMLGNS